MDGSTVVSEATVGTIGSSRAEDRVAGDAPESGATKPVVAEEQTAPPEASSGMVGPTVWP